LVAGDLHKETFKGILKKKHNVYPKKNTEHLELEWENYKKRHAKETHKRDIQQRPTKKQNEYPKRPSKHLELSKRTTKDTYERNPKKRHTKETYKRDLQKRCTKQIYTRTH